MRASTDVCVTGRRHGVRSRHGNTHFEMMLQGGHATSCPMPAGIGVRSALLCHKTHVTRATLTLPTLTTCQASCGF